MKCLLVHLVCMILFYSTFFCEESQRYMMDILTESPSGWIGCVLATIPAPSLFDGAGSDWGYRQSLLERSVKDALLQSGVIEDVTNVLLMEYRWGGEYLLKEKEDAQYGREIGVIS